MAQLKLPQEWLQIQLGDVASYGKTQKCELSDVTDDTWVLELEDIEKDSSRIISRKTAKERPFKSTKNRFERGNVLYGKLRPYLNKVVVADTDGVCTTEIIPLDSEPFVLNRYLFHWLKTRDFLNYVNDVSYGVNMPRLGTKDGVAAPFILAPLAEQKVIADKLDTLLAQVENTKARLERIPQILKRFRQSVLAAAVSGRLTEEWRSQNSLTPPRDTWPDYEEITKPFDIPSNWAGVALGSVSERVSVGHVGKTSEFYTDEESGIPFLRSQNVRPGRISLDGLAYITEPFHQSLRKSQLQPGDLLIVRVGANRGDACVLPSIFPQVNCANIVFARPQRGLSPYLNLYFQSPLSQELLLGTTVGGAQGVINTKSVAQTFLALPPVEEQTEIVRRVDQLFAHADRIEQQVNNALARVNNLTQSILAKAFRGELTEQWRKDNPERISGENSAEALLERIKAERAAVAKPKRRKANA
ncbi:hypothetical protein B9Q17_08330 [Marinobacter vinifirmus]|uniref:Type I restriction modification DNA specificity domain-containing protein n=1 Tax=Marinobacter vinifirmus TaxID=355591 RepID=A0A7Z1DVM4_9GAMM|nr:restriction endonuclease subunit S [Marinobacter vinifirmus]OZC36780.1 hypothetical protein B9Q17_08330 [Marinobacter vinifirmus]